MLGTIKCCCGWASGQEDAQVFPSPCYSCTFGNLPASSFKARHSSITPSSAVLLHPRTSVVNWSHVEKDCIICLAGMSYHMDFEEEANVRAEDMVMEYEGGFKLVCDPKSGLYLFGMRLDYSSALIGGGFQFHNPNAASSCGCGKSFGV